MGEREKLEAVIQRELRASIAHLAERPLNEETQREIREVLMRVIDRFDRELRIDVIRQMRITTLLVAGTSRLYFRVQPFHTRPNKRPAKVIRLPWVKRQTWDEKWGDKPPWDK